MVIRSDEVIETNCKTCLENEAKRNACEQRAERWLVSCTWTDGQMRLLLSFVDYHRKRSQKREWVETMREKILWILENQP